MGTRILELIIPRLRILRFMGTCTDQQRPTQITLTLHET